jgi:hypothetical protein
MKKIVQIISMLFISLNIYAQAPNWAWAKGAGGTTNDDACSTTTDASTYSAGLYFVELQFMDYTLTKKLIKN